MNLKYEIDPGSMLAGQFNIVMQDESFDNDNGLELCDVLEYRLQSLTNLSLGAFRDMNIVMRSLYRPSTCGSARLADLAEKHDLELAFVEGSGGNNQQLIGQEYRDYLNELLQMLREKLQFQHDVSVC